jgi:hypothetical protein
VRAIRLDVNVNQCQSFKPSPNPVSYILKHRCPSRSKSIETFSLALLKREPLSLKTEQEKSQLKPFSSTIFHERTIACTVGQTLGYIRVRSPTFFWSWGQDTTPHPFCLRSGFVYQPLLAIVLSWKIVDEKGFNWLFSCSVF